MSLLIKKLIAWVYNFGFRGTTLKILNIKRCNLLVKLFLFKQSLINEKDIEKWQSELLIILNNDKIVKWHRIFSNAFVVANITRGWIVDGIWNIIAKNYTPQYIHIILKPLHKRGYPDISFNYTNMIDFLTLFHIYYCEEIKAENTLDKTWLENTLATLLEKFPNELKEEI